ncbi:MAG TPA: hypothetical protein VFU38_02910, partial [Candidatus Krumholzibacteria bacterium]|nr:hypothetical protein [Candidatus Krumholzibacteria bacterium]
MNSPSTTISIRVDPTGAGERLDRFCAAQIPISRTQAQALNAASGIHVDGRARPDSYALREGEEVTIDTALLPRPRSAAPEP